MFSDILLLSKAYLGSCQVTQSSSQPAVRSVIQHAFIMCQLCDLEARKDTVAAFKKLTQSISGGVCGTWGNLMVNIY